MPAQVPFALLLVLLLLVPREGGAEGAREPPARLGVIGAGIGGASAAYFLRQEFGQDVPIDVFERGEVGGRMATINVDGQGYEAGAEFSFPWLQHMAHFVKELGLSTLQRNYHPVGFYNGDEFAFEESSRNFYWNFPKYLWNYGLSSLRMYLWVQEGMDKFTRIYSYQSQGQTFSNNQDLLYAIGGASFLQLLNETNGEAMRKAGVSQKTINGIVTPVTRVIYGQGENIHGFVGVLAMQSIDPELWSVEGGNRLVCSGLLSASKAQLIPATVLSVEQKMQQKGRSGDPVQQYEVIFQSESGVDSRLYDIVLIATPLEPGMANITFQNFHPPIPEFSRPYVQVATTLVQGSINATFFGYKDPSQFELGAILTMDNPKVFISAISSALPVERPQPKPSLSPHVWKVFSPKPLTKEQLNLLFSSYDSVAEKTWQAFPRYQVPEKVPPIILHDHMYYLNGVEYLVSGMEMSAIAAKNAALLAHHRWHGELDQVDQGGLHDGLKAEL